MKTWVITHKDSSQELLEFMARLTIRGAELAKVMAVGTSSYRILYIKEELDKGYDPNYI